MKCLKIENAKGYFLNSDGNYEELDRITKEDLLRLLNIATGDEEFEMSAYDETLLKNEAHKIIYRSLYQKFEEIIDNKNRFLDESASIYREALEKYSEK